jgi:hypothetical protein
MLFFTIAIASEALVNKIQLVFAITSSGSWHSDVTVMHSDNLKILKHFKNQFKQKWHHNVGGKWQRRGKMGWWTANRGGSQTEGERGGSGSFIRGGSLYVSPLSNPPLPLPTHTRHLKQGLWSSPGLRKKKCVK